MGILQEFKPKSKEKLSKLSKKDLEDFKMLLNKYKMSYRDKLPIKENITFGYEIECSGMLLENIETFLEPYLTDFLFELDDDPSIDNNGIEVKTPILENSESDFEIVRAVLTLLQRKTYITNQCGSHIHIGAHLLGGKKKSYRHFLKLWQAYEPVIFRFSYGEYLNERKTIYSEDFDKTYSNPMYDDIEDLLKRLKRMNTRSDKPSELSSYVNLLKNLGAKYDCFSFYKVDDYNNYCEDNTIEFRCPNGTLDPVIWQNNLNFFAHLLLYSKRDKVDDNTINERIKIGYPNHKDYHSERKINYSRLLEYRQIDFDIALELADLIFDQNIDKINFLKQYTKNFEVANKNYEIGRLKRAKKMTR